MGFLCPRRFVYPVHLRQQGSRGGPRGRIRSRVPKSQFLGYSFTCAVNQSLDCLRVFQQIFKCGDLYLYFCRLPRRGSSYTFPKLIGVIVRCSYCTSPELYDFYLDRVLVSYKEKTRTLFVYKTSVDCPYVFTFNHRHQKFCEKRLVE